VVAEVIPAEVVEAVARAIRDDDWPDHEDQIHHPIKDYMSNAHAALEVAFPRMVREAVADELAELAELLEPYSGIGLSNGATRGEVAQWIRRRAEDYRNAQ
jgi:hypothetical protein